MVARSQLMLSEILHRSVSTTHGPAYWFLNSLNIVLATSESTGGAYSLACIIREA
jgi:hypothetical protein